MIILTHYDAPTSPELTMSTSLILRLIMTLLVFQCTLVVVEVKVRKRGGRRRYSRCLGKSSTPIRARVCLCSGAAGSVADVGDRDISTVFDKASPNSTRVDSVSQFVGDQRNMATRDF